MEWDWAVMSRRNPVHGFTLVELLVTMGLMAMLATMSIAGYYGAVRGMTERGVKQDLIAFVRLAQQRALVDEVPTAVFLMNRYLRAGNQDLGEAARVVGMAVAVRTDGRIVPAALHAGEYVLSTGDAEIFQLR